MKHEAILPDPSKPRFGEPEKFLPVVFICALIGTQWLIYIKFHCLPLLVTERFYVGWIHLTVFNLMTCLLVLNYIRCITLHPGTIPDLDLSGLDTWEINPQYTGSKKTKEEPDGIGCELKRSGDRRTCKWCSKYKPDRAHHCRVCRMCILKMDHHCPWIYNCVGWRNIKYFYLLLLYSVLSLQWIIWTMMSTMLEAVNNEATAFTPLFMLLLGESLAILIGSIATLFFCFHTYLMCKGMMTIEFCEKSRDPRRNTSVYSRGTLGNVKVVLGDNVLLWFVPWSPASGDGLHFVLPTEETPLRSTQDVGKGREHRRRAHTMQTPNKSPRDEPRSSSVPATTSPTPRAHDENGLNSP
jgi:hypothetical protein